MKNHTNGRHFLLVLFFLLCISATGFAQPKAAFTSNSTAACAPLVVQFTDASTGQSLSYKWDFGNGTGSTLQNPGVLYNTSGNFTVKLVVTDANGNKDSVIKDNYVTVYAKPAIDFDATPTSGCTPLLVNFTDKTAAGSGTVTQWSWDFGDGQTSTDQNPAHNYTTTDTFSVSLTVTNSFGCTNVFQKPSVVIVNGISNADFEYTYTNACSPPTKVNFKNLVNTKDPVSYSWSFGDGSTSTDANPVYTYTANGKYPVQLIVTTDQGCKDTITKSISVGSVSPNFTVQEGACVNRKVLFKDSSSPTPVSINWYFGDGGTGTGFQPEHVYTSTGSYSVKMVANFGSCVDSTTKSFTVVTKPTASFTSTGDRATCTVPSTIQFNNTSANAAYYVWSFGTKDSSTQTNPKYTYTKAGFYDVRLIAKSINGCSDTLLVQKYVQLGPPKIDSLVGSSFSGCAGSNISFKAAVSSGEPVKTYNWDFGDGSTSNSVTPTHSYNAAGSYTITLSVTTNSGCATTVKYANKVRIGNKPTAAFSATPLNSCASDSIKFSNKSSGNITNWKWDFGDNTQGTDPSPKHLYKDTGLFTVKLLVSSNGCADSIQQVNYIHVNAPVAGFNYSLNCKNRLLRNFNDSSIAAKTWQWDFGDNTASTDKDPSHIYAGPGTYYVSLTVTNAGCTSIKNDTIKIIDNSPSFTASPASGNICKYDSIVFKAKYNASTSYLFYWNFGDGTSSPYFSVFNTTVAHSYKKAGNYSPYLIIKDLVGCYDTSKPGSLPVNVYGPTAQFTNTPYVCANGTIKFVDKSTTDNVPHPIKQWIWNYGDGTGRTSLTPGPFGHVYKKGGIYDVTLKVVDAYGCYDTILVKSADTIGQPIAKFAALDTIRCSASAINFLDSSTGFALNYLWNFGDAKTSTTIAPQHLYTDAGIYTVSLVVKDKFGCKDTSIKTDYIKISNPKASFSIKDTVHYCPPWEITPKSTSSGYAFLTWQFGDANSSNLPNPKHKYIMAGTYDLMLIAQGYGNCYDTAHKKLQLLGPAASLSYPDAPFCAPGTVLFKAKSQNVAAYQWFFGDGQVQAGTGSSISYNYTTPGTFLPSLTIVDSSGNCEVHIKNDGDSIRVGGIIAKFGAATAPGCDSAAITFTDSTKVFFDALASRTWDFGDGLTATTENPVHYYSTTGTKSTSLNLVTASGCTAKYSLPVDVTVHKSPVLSATIPSSVCINSQADFKASNSATPPGIIQWYWQFGNGVTDTLQNTNYTYTAAGTYTASVTATNEFGCADTAVGNVVVQPLPAVDAGLDTVICFGQTFTMQPTGADTYVWAANPTLSCTNCANPIAKPDSTTMYYVAGTSAAGCINTDSITIQVKRPITIALKPVDTLCIGNSIQLIASGAEVYNWQPSTGLDNPNIANPTASPAVTTTYTVTGTDTKQCFSNTATAIVNVFAKPTVSISPNAVTVMQANSYTPVSTTSPDVVTWQWSPPVGVSCVNCAQPTITPRQTTTYTETVVNQYGCFDTSSITITVLCNDKSLFIPNTFSPNGDGTNDYFYPRGEGLYSIKSMRIFNRWGKTVFERVNFAPNDQANAWDGKVNGVLQPSDVYVYIIETVCNNGTVLTSKGDVTLLR